MCFKILTELCKRVEETDVQRDVHSVFLSVPHACQLLGRADLRSRAQLPTVADVLSCARKKVVSPHFSWRGRCEGASSVRGAPGLGVAVSAVWSFGVVQSPESPATQVRC